jgi:hypothetical protein
MVELQQTAPTHYSPSKLTCSRIDRIYTTTPGWILTNLQCSASLLEHPRELHEKGISDHGPVSTSISLKRRLPRELQPIPRFIAESDHFKKRHDELVTQTALRKLPPVQRWELHKVILRQAGEHAREKLVYAAEHTEFEVNQSLTTIARTVWHNDVRLARKLLRCSDLAKLHLSVTDDTVTLTCPPSFKSCVEAAKTAYYAKLKDKVDLDHPEAASNIKSSKLRAVSRLAQLWAPQDKRLVLAAVKAPSDYSALSVTRRPDLRSAALAAYCSSTYSPKKFDEAKARSFCATWCAPAARQLIKPPSSMSVRAFIKSSKHSKPGPDGLPYAAWDAAGDAGAETLLEVNDFLASGYTMPVTYSDQLMLFVVKGEDQDDAYEVCRVAADTRPLSLKNTDNKIIA